MSTTESGVVLPPVIDRTLRGIRRVADVPGSALENLGRQLSFYIRAIGWIPRVLKRYWKEVLRILAEVTLGSGALTLIAGTVGVILFLSFFTGTQVGLELFKGLQSIGAEAFSGLSTGYGNTREIAPLIAGLALAAQVGCGFTAQLGAMRISEEIDALEVMGIPSLPYLVTTRMLAAFIAIMPLYAVGLLSTYFSSRLIVTKLQGQSSGTYDHYFHLFLPPQDVIYSMIKVAVFAVVVTLVHCYYGYYASGGPAGVGVAVGRAIRTSIVAVAIINLFLSMALWGTTVSVRIAG